MVRARRASGGTAISVTDDAIWSALEGAATVAALPHLTKSGDVSPTDRVGKAASSD